MRVLVACEYSGRTRNAFAALGHDVMSCDLLPSEDDSPAHYQGDVFDLIDDGRFDLMIAHPPCTYLSVSGLHWNGRTPGRAEKTEEALEFVRRLMAVDIPKIAIENPVSCISSRIRKPDQVIQPWWFGDDASKATCLWLKGLPKLVALPIDMQAPPESLATRGAGETRPTAGRTSWRQAPTDGKSAAGRMPESPMRLLRNGAVQDRCVTNNFRSSTWRRHEFRSRDSRVRNDGRR